MTEQREPLRKASPDDATLRHARRLLAAPPAAPDDLAGEYAALTDAYSALLHKLHKTIVISDSYQSQLLELNSTLSQRVEKETERRLAQERLLTQKSKLAALGEMIDAIAHQWRQPLMTVSIIIQTIREARRLGKLDDSTMERTADSALAQIRYMTETIETFRGFFRPTKGRESFPVSVKVAEAVALFQLRLRGKGISLDVADSGGDDTINSFSGELIQVMINLLANSCEAILEQQQRTAASAGEGRIAVTVVAGPGQVVIEVEDNGCGIPCEDAPRLFEPDFSTKKNREGSGMGLYMSRLIVEESLGGKISFVSVPGQTVFRLELPKSGRL